MDVKRNIRFFKQNDVLRLFGAALAIVGLIWFYFGMSMASYYGPIVMMPVGITLFIVCSARAVPESEIRQCVTKAQDGLGRDVTEGREGAYVRREFCAEGQYYDEYATLFRRVKDAKVLSDASCKTMLYLTDDALLVRSRRVVLATGEIEDNNLRLEWNELDKAEIVPYETRVKLSNSRKAWAGVRGACLVLSAKDGSTVCRVPIQNDVDAEKLCEEIARSRNAAING